MIDVHAHWYPRAALGRLADLAPELVALADQGATSCLTLGGSTTAIQLDPSMWDVGARAALVDELGIDLQVVSLGAIDVGWAGAHAPEVCDVVNDELAAFAEDDRYEFLCSVPLADPDRVGRTLERAVAAGAVGVSLTTTYGGRPLSDDGFRPAWRLIAEAGLPVSVHPCVPRLGADGSSGTFIPVGFTCETMSAASDAVLNGLFEDVDGLEITWSHLGGGLAMMLERLDASCRMHDRTLASHLFRTRCHFDTACSGVAAFRCAADVFGVGRLVFGTDMPHRLEVPETLVATLDAACADAGERSAVGHDNAARLFGIGRGVRPAGIVRPGRRVAVAESGGV